MANIIRAEPHVLTQTYEVDWTGRLTSRSDYYNWKQVLYMYMNRDFPIYIGKAYHCTVGQRYDAHLEDGVIEHVKSIDPNFRVRVGFVVLEDGRNISEELVTDIESLLIYNECAVGNCLSNIQHSKSRPIPTPGMIVKNLGSFKPLWKRYVAD